MLELPLPMLSALLCLVTAVILLRIDLGRRIATWFFVALFIVFTFEALLVALRFGYGNDRLILVQRMLPLFVGPLMYLGFAALALPSADRRRQTLYHLGLAFGVNGVFAVMPPHMASFDWAISLSYVFYIICLLRLWRRGPDHLIHARLEVAQHITRWMLSAAGLLLVILLTDTAIALSFALNRGAQASALITIGSTVLIAILLVMLICLPSLLAAKHGPAPRPAITPTTDHARIEAETRALLEKTQLYLDPDLSVQRLSRRMHLPERALSGAINQSQGINISQYVNGFRLAHAAGLLTRTNDSVAKIMTQSGFLTRSNFYREFQRVYGQSPASYRASQQDK